MPSDPFQTCDCRPAPAPAVEAVKTQRLFTRDFEQISSLLQRWNCNVSQLDEGHFLGDLRFADLQAIQILDARLNRSILLRGGHPADAYVFSPIEPANTDARWRGRQLRPGMLNARTPDTELDHRTCPMYASADLVIDARHLRASARCYLGIELEDLLPRSTPVTATPASTTALADLIRSTLDGVESSDIACIQPAVDRLVTSLLDLLAAGRPVPEVRMSSSRRKEIVRQAEMLVVGNPGVSLSLLQLAAVTGVSKRTLDHAFLDVTGLPPKTYLKAMRLNHTRRELQRRRPERGIVRRIANRWGFFRSDHFAADFQQQFGELPSSSVGRKVHEATPTHRPARAAGST